VVTVQIPAAAVDPPMPPMVFLGAVEMRTTRGHSKAWAIAAFAVIVLVALTAADHRLLAQSGSPGEPKSDAAAAGRAEPIAKSGLVPTTNLLRIMQDGGILMWPLAFCSLVGLTFVFERLISLRWSRVIPGAFVKRLLEQVREGDLDRPRALEVCQQNHSPAAEVLGAAVRKWGRSAVEVEQGILDAGERATNGLRRYLRVFTALTVISPLLGLLGTVFGMIEAFNAVATSEALGRPELLAKGISRALLNTAFGLAVAIPAQSFYFFFVSRVDRLVIEMDRLGQELVELISAEGLQNRGDEGRPSKARRTARREAA
jgi:biopolymer transport protein ExbB